MNDTDGWRRALLSPRHVALVGSSDNIAKTTARPQAFLRRNGWPGTVLPVNPTHATVQGERAWRSVSDLPVVPDHAFVLTGADAAIDVVAECAERGVAVVSIIADGFVGPSPAATARRRALLAAAARGPVRVLGPSTLGVVNVHESLMLTANAVFAEPDVPPGGIFVASQSGGAMGALASRGRAMGLGFAAMVSTGSELDLTLGEICLSTVDDPRVTSYAIFLESLAGADDLRRFAVAAAQRGKPVLAYKLGRSAPAAELALSHTGAITGADDVASAFLADIGVGRVTIFETLLEALPLAGRVPVPARPNRRPRVGVVSTTGGGGAMAVDCLAVRGIDVSPPSETTARRLRAAGIGAGTDVLVDLTLAGTRYDVMRAALDVLLDAPEYDLIVAVPGSSARFHPELAVKPIVDSVGAGKPLSVFVMPDAPDTLRLLRESGVAAFHTPESLADGIVAVFNRGTPRAVEASPRVAGPPATLDEAAAYRLLDRLGVPHAAYAVVPVDAALADLPAPGPVAVKALSADLPHKSDAGGVVLGVATTAALRSAIDGIVREVARRTPDGVSVDQVLVQSMVDGVGEVLVGLVRDPDAGPMVVLAAGGVLTEILRDRSVRPAPVDEETAWEMIAEVAYLRALDGFRGDRAGDLAAVARVVVAVSRAASLDRGAVEELEVNPLVVREKGKGAVAVDALARVRERS